ncbi:MAG: UDP-N-acetylglucosamine 2-epimerase (non-hydrolyzing) [Vicingaceae bacterium]|jgi:UDP-N-acetylglucosamine 2-epimerase (non-hydrolysing)|nr:UDP-N-acetylglucosamine 2-epimerase (non-hydrolyzing) [Flavobacteriales bacterium]MBQ19615.1 UDP-N-acetylglucosamine 2-epimerase (non-hydrolyzing) [Flavobacteriales bacterium]MDF1675507.1 UDP-N-acetylglucosamine 2-epimerase (non-hydrolyzing) [Vicingaceae bacterium]|tara:strand:- start:135582 stop:136685 length:1104 start_codon:yes stop_codon:yes gene_type:complete
MTKKIMVVVGTRPNFIKITQLEKELAKYGNTFEYILIHTNQHYDTNMSDIFFTELNLKEPNFLSVTATTPSSQIGQIIIELEKVIKQHQPDALIVVGDVNSTLAGAIVGNKTNTLLFHLESGLRSFDNDMPEEINRLITDLVTNHFFVTEQSGYDNLIAAGKKADQIHFVGNTMIDTLVAFDNVIQKNNILDKLNIVDKDFVLMTIHRPSNVDTKERLLILLDIINKVAEKNYLVIPIHHRTKNSLINHNLFKQLENNPKVIITEALNYLAFQKLIASCQYVLTDSGGIQEETTYRQVPCLTLRENTERPITITLGTNELVEYNYGAVAKKINEIETGNYKKGEIPPMWDGQATKRIVKVLHEILTS